MSGDRRERGTKRVGAPTWVAPTVGLSTVLVLCAIVAVAVGLFRGSFDSPAAVTVLSERAGLVMNPDAKVKMRGVVVGRVATIVDRPDGTAEIQLAMDPGELTRIPSNVRVDIASTTVFGAKYVQLIPPSTPSPERMRAGQTIRAEHVTVEINTVFQQLVSVLSVVQPDKLNQTLGAISTAFHGRGREFGQAIADLDAYLAKIEPSLPTLSQDLAAMPTALGSFADAAPDLLRTADQSNTFSRTIVADQTQLDDLLVGVTGLGDVGTDVLTASRKPLTDTLQRLGSITDLTAQYEEALYCGIAGLLPVVLNPPLKHPGIEVMAAFMWGNDRWRYPDNLPKVAAKGGSQCTDMPRVPFMARPPFVVTDTGANPWERNTPGITLNSAGLKEMLYGPQSGPPRNSGQIGMPG